MLSSIAELLVVVWIKSLDDLLADNAAWIMRSTILLFRLFFEIR